MNNYFSAFCLSCSVLSAYASAADKSDNDLSFNFDASAQHNSDSAVGVDEIDQNSRQSDSGLQLKIKPGLSWQLSKNIELNTAYELTQQRFFELSQFDTDISQFTGAVKTKSDAGDISYRFDKITAKLDGDSFLDLDVHTADWGKLIHNLWYWRLAYTHKRKTFTEQLARNAHSDGVGSQLFWFFNKYQSNLTLGVNFENEEANNTAFSYQAIQWHAGLSHKVNWFKSESRLKASLHYRELSYDTITLHDSNQDLFSDAFGESDTEQRFARSDHYLKLKLSFEQELGAGFYWLIASEYQDQQSNLPQADFDRYIFRAGAGFNY